MLIPWHLAAKFGIIWGVGAILSFLYGLGTGDFTGLAGSAGASSNLLDASLAPQSVTLDNPSLGEGAGDLGLSIEFLNAAKNWTLFAVRALALDYEFLGTSKWLQLMRWILLAFAAPFGLNLALIGAEFLARMIRGLSRIPIPFLGRFLGG